MVGRDTTTGIAGQTLSVVLPNYNHARYLPRALDALLSQDCRAEEIIIVDDCSTDGSLDIITRYVANNPSIRLLANLKNMGTIAALSRGLNDARGQYIYFGAADDFVMPGFFAAAIKMLQANSHAGLFCGEAILIDGYSGRALGVRPPVRPRFCAGFVGPSKVARLLRRNDNFILTGAAVFRRDAVVSVGGFDERLLSFADGYLVRKVALTYGFYYFPRAVQTWCVFPDSVSRMISTDADQAQRIIGKIELQIAADPTFPRWYQEVFVRRWRFASSRLAVNESAVKRDLLMDMGAQNAIDRVLFRCVLNIFSRQKARLLILTWLWIRFRPYSLIGIGSTALARKLAVIRIK